MKAPPRPRKRTALNRLVAVVLAAATTVVVVNVVTGGDLVDQWFRGATGLYAAVASEPDDLSWDCVYDPTMNDDWHDDIICWRGVESIRPILLEGQFVTEAGMIAAGEAYEAELNG